MLKYTLDYTCTPAANPTTIFQVLAGSAVYVHITGIDLSLRGASPATAPVPFDWVVQSTAGTMTSQTPVRQDRGLTKTISSTCTVNATVEPGGNTPTIWVCSLHQQATLYWRPVFPIRLEPSERVGLRYRSSTYVEVAFTIYLEE